MEFCCGVQSDEIHFFAAMDNLDLAEYFFFFVSFYGGNGLSV